MCSSRGPALWSASRPPQPPSFPLKESSAVAKDRNGMRAEAVLGSVDFNQEVPFKLSLPFKLHQVKSAKARRETFLFMAAGITLEMAAVAEGGGGGGFHLNYGLSQQTSRVTLRRTFKASFKRLQMTSISAVFMILSVFMMAQQPAKKLLLF